MNRLAKQLLSGLVFAALAATTACDTANTKPNTGNPTPTPVPTSGFSNETYAAALRSASVKLRGKLPVTADIQDVLANGEPSYQAIIDRYLGGPSGLPYDPLQNPDLTPALRDFYRAFFLMGGTVTTGALTTNYDLPPNMAVHLIINDKPVSDLVTAEYCVANDYSMMPPATEITDCDGAPAGMRAGVISQRPFLKKFGDHSTLNMRRTSVVHQIFACEIYPDTLSSTAQINRSNDITHEDDPDGAGPLLGDNTDPALGSLNYPVNDNTTPADTTDDFVDPALGSYMNDPALDANSVGRISKKWQSKLKGAAAPTCVACHVGLNSRRPVFTPFTPNGRYNAARTMASTQGTFGEDGGALVLEDNNVEAPSVNGNKDYCGNFGDTDDPGTNLTDDDVDPNSFDCQNGGLNPGYYFGNQMANLKEFGALIANPAVAEGRFYSCMATRHYNFALGKSQGVLAMQAANGSGPTGVDPAILSKYRTVYESSGWNTRELLRQIFKGPEFLAAQQ